MGNNPLNELMMPFFNRLKEGGRKTKKPRVDDSRLFLI